MTTAMNFDYQKLARQKQLNMRIDELNRAREKVLDELESLGVELPAEEIVRGGQVDPEALEQEKKFIAKLQADTYEQLQQQQADDLVTQAREGSRFVVLERRLKEHPDLLAKVNWAPLQTEQEDYIGKQLEIFDYLLKHFTQFASVEVEKLPEAGEKFYAQVVEAVTAQMEELVQTGRSLQAQIEEKSKRLAKLRRREQRELEIIHAEIGKNLTDDDIGSKALVEQNAQYQELLSEIKVVQALKTSLLNQAIILVDEGIVRLQHINEALTSIVGQNRMTREILFELKTKNKVWDREKLREYVQEALVEFDQKIALMVDEQLEQRYGEGELTAQAKKNFAEMIEEIISFQEYLGQIMGDSAQIIGGNVDDLENARIKYGRLVLDFVEQTSIL
ncbi:hypothetical protein IJJ27_02590 [bacterium]|nr:hypothetical protein [bacterium]